LEKVKMKNAVSKSLKICLALVILSLILSACGKTSSTEITLASTGSVTSTPQKTVLTLEEADKQLSEKGFLNVASIQDASTLAGFQVVVPSFIPQGFSAGNFSVMLQPGGIPTSTVDGSAQAAKSVQQSFAQNGASDVIFTLTEGLQVIGSLPKSQPITINGRPGEKLLITGPGANRLVLAWDDGKRFYQLAGIISGALDEATLDNIANSLSVH
jgi:hypothetical protein